jgi:hypothetical protein
MRDWGRIGDNSEAMADRFNHSVDGIPYDYKFLYGVLGYNMKSSEMNAAFGLVQLERFKDFEGIRRANVERYIENLQGVGDIVLPDDSTFKAAAANADWNNAPGMYLLLTWQTGKDAWPATGASFILMHKQQADALTGRAILKFFDWSYKNGGQMSTELEYVHMPVDVIKLVQENWKKDFRGPDNNPIWK